MESDKKEDVHHQRLFCVITVARQIEGEYVFIKTEKAFTKASKADALLKSLKQQYVDDQGKPKSVSVSTANGDANCFCEVGAFELEIED